MNVTGNVKSIIYDISYLFVVISYLFIDLFNIFDPQSIEMLQT